MIVTIHQPEHLPWGGFFAKLAVADLYIVLDTVQYRRRYFQNRNRVLAPAGEARWLTVPVVADDRDTLLIQDALIANATDWRRGHWRTLQHCYGRHPWWATHAAALEVIYARAWERLVDLNVALLRVLTGALGIQTPMRRASDLLPAGTAAKGALMLALAQAAGADTYLSGPFGRQYLDEEVFRAAGVALRYHDWTPVRYGQHRRATFVPELSVIDLLFNQGPRSLDVLRLGLTSERAPTAVGAPR